MSRSAFYCRCGARLVGASERLDHRCPKPARTEAAPSTESAPGIPPCAATRVLKPCEDPTCPQHGALALVDSNDRGAVAPAVPSGPEPSERNATPNVRERDGSGEAPNPHPSAPVSAPVPIQPSHGVVYAEGRAFCTFCSKPLEKARARWDGEDTWVGYHPCDCRAQQDGAE